MNTLLLIYLIGIPFWWTLNTMFCPPPYTPDVHLAAAILWPIVVPLAIFYVLTK